MEGLIKEQSEKIASFERNDVLRKANIHDEEEAQALVDRWKAVGGKKPFSAWMAKEAKEDKIARKFLPEPPKAPPSKFEAPGQDDRDVDLEAYRKDPMKTLFGKG